MRTCKQCEVEKSLDEFGYVGQRLDLKGERYRRYTCKSCTVENHKGYSRKYYEQGKQSGKKTWELRRFPSPIAYYAFTICLSAKNRAASKGWEFDLDAEWIEAHLQSGRCQVTGLPFDFGQETEVGDRHFNPWAPSIDRIDSTKGYTKDNVQFVVWAYNMAKGALTREEFMTLVKALAKPLFAQALSSGRISIQPA